MSFLTNNIFSNFGVSIKEGFENEIILPSSELTEEEVKANWEKIKLKFSRS